MEIFLDGQKLVHYKIKKEFSGRKANEDFNYKSCKLPIGKVIDFSTLQKIGWDKRCIRNLEKGGIIKEVEDFEYDDVLPLKKIQDTLKTDNLVFGEDKVKGILNSGLLDDDTFFQTIFLQDNGIFKPSVVINENILPVHDNEIELMGLGAKRKDIRQEDRYQYFEYDGIKYKFLTELFFRENFKINTVDKEVLKKIKNKKYPKNIYDKVIKKIKCYWDHYNKYAYDVIAVNVFETPILRAIGKTFYLVTQGKEDTGKSTLQKLLAKLEFNGLFGGKGTVALNVRLAHYLGCNINQDELDKNSKEENKVFIGVANTGLYSDGTYSLIDTNKKSLRDQITILNTFSKKTFSTNNLFQFDSSFLSRCYVLICTRQGRKLNDINDLSSEDLREFQELRNDIFVYCMFNWKSIKQSIQEVKNELEGEGIFGRKTDRNSIILGIIKHFKGDYYKEVKEHLKEKEGLQEEDRSTTKESLTFEFLANRFLQEDKVIEVGNKEIAGHIATELNLSEEEQKGLSRTIGWIFRNYDLVRRKENTKRGTRGERKYIIEKSVFLDMLKRFQYGSLLNKLVSEPTFRNGKNVRNGRSFDVSDVSEHRFQIEEKIVENALQFDTKLIQHLPCSIQNCPETECNLDGKGKPYCQNHWQEYAKK